MILVNTAVLGNANKKEFVIHGSELVCGRHEAVYTSNYNVVRKIRWEITGGEIVAINGQGIAEFYNSYMSPDDVIPDGPIISFEYNTLGSGEVTYVKSGSQQTITLSSEFFYSLVSNPANSISVNWASNGVPLLPGYGIVTAHAEGLGEFGVDGSGVNTMITRFESKPLISITQPTNVNLTCNQGVSVSASTSGNWSAAGAAVSRNWGNGIYIDHFSQVGNVPISVSISNLCGTASSTIHFNITQPDFGSVQQNGTDVSVVQPDCQGAFYLSMPWKSNYAYYTWSLPDFYDAQTNTYAKTIQKGNNLTNIRGVLPTGSLTDFVGTVTITGLCGQPVVKSFIVRPTLQPSVDADIYSCSNSVVIKVNNPNGTTNINPWVSSAYLGGYGSFINNSVSSTTFTGSKADDYKITIGVNTVNNCYVQLQTTVHTSNSGSNNAGGGVVNSGTTSSAGGWQAGVLSDNRVKPGSNLAIYNSNIYFGGRDGNIYFYSYSALLQKWVINQIPGITNAAIPVASSFNKIGIATFGTVTYLFYTNNIGLFKKVDLSTNTVSEGIGIQLAASDIVATGNDMYVLDKGSNLLFYNTSQISVLPSATLKTIIAGYGLSYIQNNNLYSTTLGQLTYTNDLYATSDVVAQSGYLYYTRGQKGSANLFRLPLSNPVAIEQITTSTNLSGVYTINPASGVIYYSILDNPTFNTTYTVTSGVYKAANIYQAHLQGSTWLFNAATIVKPRENLDMYIHSPVFNGNHVFYIGAGHNGNIGDAYELEVWNLYYENACAPVLQRVATTLITDEIATSITLYPNPFTGLLQLDLSAYTDIETGVLTTTEVEILDASGKLVYTHTLLSELNVISTADWATGMYLVKIKHNQTILTKKVVKIN